MSRRFWVHIHLLFWLYFLTLGSAQGGKVLVLPADGSHWLSMKLLVVELIHRGHEVLVLVPENNLLMRGAESYKTEVYQVPYTKDELDANIRSLQDGLFDKPADITDMFLDAGRFSNFTSLQVKGCESLLNNQPLMSHLRGEDFSVVLTDPFLPCGPILAQVFSIPAVYFLRGLPCQLDTKANQCPSPPSYVPVYYSGNTNIMTFPQRVKNLVMSVVETYICQIFYCQFDDLVSRYLGDITTYKDLLSHGAFWLLRQDFAFEWPKPLMPNMALIGGINCVKTALLPADLQEFVDASGDNGFIVFTLGSTVPKLPEKMTREFFSAFQQIPQRVVWRYSGVPPVDVPQSVKLMKWLPQNDLLAHPKAKVFITHGGSHGVYEGICNAVPMLMFPLFGDQGDNVERMVAHGVAEKLSIHDVTSEKLLAALKKILHDKSYREKVEELSQVHLDRPVEPLDLAVFWTEFVMRHRGAAHLRVAAHNLNWIQYHCLDVMGFLVLVLLTSLWLILRCCWICSRRCFREESAEKKKKKKKEEE